MTSPGGPAVAAGGGGSPPVRIGEIIAGKYRVERVLGIGAMGVVVAATHVDLHELRAIKLMLPSMLGDVEGVERFLREARAVSKLRSRHVAAVFGPRAASQWSSAKAECADPIKGESCTSTGIELGKDANGSATLSTVGFVVGGAALLTGTILWFRFAPPKPLAAASSVGFAPVFGPEAGGARLEGSF